MSESEIIHSVLSGNRNAFIQLVEKYQQMVFRTCMGFVHQKEDADDLTQEVFINAYQSLPKFKGDSAFSTWLYRIAVNISLNHIRNTSKRSIFQRIENKFNSGKLPEIQMPAIDFENPEKMMIEDEHRMMVKKMLDTLPENQRTALVLSKYEDLSQKEIAQIMDITEGAVEALIQRGKVNIRKNFEKIHYKP